MKRAQLFQKAELDSDFPILNPNFSHGSLFDEQIGEQREPIETYGTRTIHCAGVTQGAAR